MAVRIGSSPSADRGRLAATYSIVARDSQTGELGAAAQSHYFAVGSEVPWAEEGVGAVVTQAFVNTSYGPEGLRLLREGKSPAEALQTLVAADAGREVRQVALLDAQGRVAAHTGAACIQAAGHHAGSGYSVQGNMLRSDAVWQAMPESYESATGDLADRLLASLEAAERAGGDIRGRQSAVLLVVSGERRARSRGDRRIDLRVDDHRNPLGELRRLLGVQRAYDLLEQARQSAGEGNLDEAERQYEAAQALCPENLEFSFWAGVILATTGRLDRARQLLQRTYVDNPGWRELLRRLAAAGLIPKDQELLAKLLDSDEG